MKKFLIWFSEFFVFLLLCYYIGGKPIGDIANEVIVWYAGLLFLSIVILCYMGYFLTRAMNRKHRGPYET